MWTLVLTAIFALKVIVYSRTQLLRIRRRGGGGWGIRSRRLYELVSGRGRWDQLDALSEMNMMVFSLELFCGSEMYVDKPPISSVRPAGLPSWTLPERQHELIPTF